MIFKSKQYKFVFKPILSVLIVYMFAFDFSFSSSFLQPDDFENQNNTNKVLIFLSKDCPCSHSHIEHINKLTRDFPNFSFFGVITDTISDKNITKLENYYSNHNFKFPIIKDKFQILVKKYKALKTPHAIVISSRFKNTNSYIVYSGGVSDSYKFSNFKKLYLKENLISLSQTNTLKYAHGKSLGCYIRRL